ncbi:hypothetical protein [Streptomyces sp. NPDC056190]|uniref:hypothetical protein n=1 Tax=unclassified Streptomyces TaxID=2593676 RepID=UPI0035E2AAEA
MLIEGLLSIRRLPAAAVIGGMQAALDFGSVRIDMVAIEARQCDAVCEETGGSPAEEAKVVSRHALRLPPDPRPLPDMSTYDRLLKPVTSTTSKKDTSA